MPPVWRLRRVIARKEANRDLAPETRTAEARFGRSSRGKRARSGAAPPQTAVAPRHELQVVLVAGPFFVLRQPELLLRRFPAFPFARRDLHRRRGILQERELVLRVLLGPQPVAWSRMARDQALPIHCEHLLDRLLPFERIEVDDAAAPTATDRAE